MSVLPWDYWIRNIGSGSRIRSHTVDRSTGYVPAKVKYELKNIEVYAKCNSTTVIANGETRVSTDQKQLANSEAPKNNQHRRQART